MRILHTVEFYYPSKGGSQEVVRQLSERLVKLGHDVTVATTKLPDRQSKLINGVKIVEFEISGNEVRGYSGDINEYKNFLRKSSFDVIMNYAAQQWATDLCFQVIDEIKAKKVLVPCGFSGLYDESYKTYFEKMPEIMKKYDASVYLSDNYRDINFVRDHQLNNLHLIPNGAGEDEFLPRTKVDIRRKLGIPENHFLILLVGSHTGVKGHAEAIEIFKRAKIQDVTLLIIGNDLGGGCTNKCHLTEFLLKFSLNFKINRKKLIIADLTRQETVDAYKQSDLFLFPSNIEASPIVLFESIAAKTPFLTTDVGNSGEIIEWTGGGKLLPTKRDKEGYSHAEIDLSARTLEKTISDKKDLARMATKGFSAWKQKFSWEKIAKEYEKLYLEILQRKKNE